MSRVLHHILCVLILIALTSSISFAAPKDTSARSGGPPSNSMSFQRFLHLRSSPKAVAAPAPAAPAPQKSKPQEKNSPVSAQAMAERAEKRIKAMHDKLGITPDEEESWDVVAETMRNNEARLIDLIHERHRNARVMNALEQLDADQEILQARLDGVVQIRDAFQPLYDAMTYEQKKNADRIFKTYQRQIETAY